ncbi:Gamma-tubulin complex component 3 like protein [Dictyocoela muelleri]|nr:Gamma-tubulin complex component 3 like protein [Dictyocoela muelleri]
MEEKINNLAFEFSKMTRTPKPGFYKKIKNKIKFSNLKINDAEIDNQKNIKIKKIYDQHKLDESDKKFLAFLLRLKTKMNIRDIKHEKNNEIDCEMDKYYPKIDNNSNHSNPNNPNNKNPNNNIYNDNLDFDNSDKSKIEKDKKIDSILSPSLQNSNKEETDIIFLLEKNIKKGALGIQTNLFDEHGVYILSSILEPQIYEIVIQVYHHAQVYKKLRENQSFLSKAQLEFYEIVRHQLKCYENEVLRSDEKLLNFHVEMQHAYRNLEIVNHLFDSFFTNPKNPFEFLKIYKNSLYFLELQFIDQVVVASSREINRQLNSWVYEGTFIDPGNEFFIVKNDDSDLWNSFGINYGLVPYFMSHEVVEKILYLGKCKVLLKEVKSFDDKQESSDDIRKSSNDIRKSSNDIKKSSDDIRKSSDDIRKSSDEKESSDDINKSFESNNKLTYDEKKSSNDNLDEHENIPYILDILDPNLPDYLDILFKDINLKIEKEILIKHDIFEYFKFTKEIFLGFRSDFIEMLLIFMSDMQKGAYFNKRSISYILDSALVTTFGNNKFIKNIDICIFDDAYDYISLFYHLNFPLNLIVTKEIILKFVAVFKFIYKLKRVESVLSANLKRKEVRKFRNIILKINFYVFEEVIEDLWKYEFIDIDDFRKQININLENILKRIFQVPNKGKEQLDSFIASLEKYAIGESRISISFVEEQFKEFVSVNRDIVLNSYLSDFLKNEIIN